MASYGQRRRRTQTTTTIGTGGAVNKLAQKIGQRQSGFAQAQGADRYQPTQAQRQAQRPGAPPVNLRDLQRNVATGGMTQQQAATVGGQRATLFSKYGKNWKQRVYGSDFKEGELGKLKGQIAFGDAAAAQGAPLPGNLTTEKLAAARARYAELIAKRKKALGQA